MLQVIPQICLQCGATTEMKSVQAEIQLPSTANGYTIGFGKFTFTFCNVEHFMRWMTSLLTKQVERSKSAQDRLQVDTITTFSEYSGDDWDKDNG